jgi:hypothetical protein
MPLKVRAWDGSKWNGFGRFPEVDAPTPADPFSLRTTRPVWFGTNDARNNVGCAYGVTRSNYSGNINFSNGPVNISNLNLSSLQNVVGSGHRVTNCRFTGSYPISSTNVNGGGVVKCTDASVSDFRMDFCEIEPATPGDRFNGVYGHDFTFSRGAITKTVDGFGIYTAAQGGETVRNVNARVEGSWIGFLSWYRDDTSGGTRNTNGHTDGSGTHNDGIQWGAGYYVYVIGNTFNLAKFNALNPGNVTLNDDESYTLAAGNGIDVLAESTTWTLHTVPQVGQAFLGQHSVGLVDYVWYEDNWLFNGETGFKVQSNASYLGSTAHRPIAHTSVQRNKFLGRWRDTGGTYHSYPLRTDSNCTINGVKRAGGTYVDDASNSWSSPPTPQYFAGQSIFHRIDAVTAP